MSLTLDEVKKVAFLARLHMTEKDLDKQSHNLSNILDLIEKMNAIDTTGVEPMNHPLDLKQNLRTDQVTETNQRELFQTLAFLVESGFYLVPPFIEE